MKVQFESKFKEEIAKLGNTVCLKYYYKDDVVPNTPGKYVFQSLWYEEDKSLNMTLDFSELETEDIPGDSLYVYYSDLNDNVLGLAFTLTIDPVMDPVLNFCYEKRDNGMTRNLNHITVFFPSSCVANIETRNTNEDVQFIEAKSEIVGLNTFLAVEHVFDDSEYKYLTKDSYNRYVRNLVSSNNYDPIYLNKNGEKVFDVSSYKHYKSITIEASNATPMPGQNTDKLVYYISNGSIATIIGTVVYDLYRVSNGEYTLISRNLTEDLTATLLQQIEDDVILPSPKEACIISQVDKSIEFNSDQDTETNDFLATMNFISEIDDPELGYTKGVSSLIKSNIVEFITYLRWNVEYPSNLIHDDGNLVIIMDYPMNSTDVWSADNEDIREATIILYSQSKLRNIETDITITQESEEMTNLFNQYFYIQKPREGIWDNTNRRWIYELTISTLLDNDMGSMWAPMVDGQGVMILNTITVLGSTRNSNSTVRFYIVQRPHYPLALGQATTYEDIIVEDNKVVFPAEIGKRSIDNLYIVNSVEGYNKWESDYSDLDSDVVITSIGHTVMEDINSLESGNSITAITRVPASDTEIPIGTITFRRRNTDGAYDPSKWLDVMYCGKSNDLTVSFYVEAREPVGEDETSWDILPADGFVNYPDAPGAATKYYYTGDNETYYNLFLFDSSETKKFKVKQTDLTVESLTFNEAVRNYFNISVESSEKYTTFSFTSKLPRTSDKFTWNPKYQEEEGGEYLPYPISIGNDLTFYCVIRPALENTISFRDADSENYSKISEALFKGGLLVDEEGKMYYKKNLYITSSIFSSEFNNWCVFQKDSEVGVTAIDSASGTTLNNNAGGLLLEGADFSTQAQIVRATTTTQASTADAIDFENLVVRRTLSGKYYTGPADLYDDWRNQLVENSRASLKMAVVGKDPSDNMTIYYQKNNSTELTELLTEKDPYLELDYLGIYKIFVKSNSKFRVSLENTNSDDHFYFYDNGRDQTKYSILTIDEGSFDSVVGREVCFSFFGHEKGTFDCEDQILRTNIRVINLTDGSSLMIPLHRRYFLDKNMTRGNLDSNIKSADDSSNRVILEAATSSSGRTSVIRYKSNLETILTFTPRYWSTGELIDPGVSVNIKNPLGDISMSYIHYSKTSDVQTLRTNRVIGSRGYLGHTNEVSISVEAGADSSYHYPLPVSGTINLRHPGKLYNFNREEKAISLYRIRKGPQITNDAKGGYVRMSYDINSTETFNVTYDRDDYEVYFKKTSQSEYTKVSNKYQAFSFDDDKGQRYKVERIGTVSAGVDSWSVTTETRYSISNEDTSYTAGGLKFVTYVPKDEFLLDEEGNKIVGEFTQSQVDGYVSPNESRVEIYRLCKKDSKNSIEGGNPEDIISRWGEDRQFVFSMIDDTQEVNYETTQSTWEDKLSSIVYDKAGGELLKVHYKDKVNRYNTGRGIDIRYTSSNIGGSYLYNLDEGIQTKLYNTARDPDPSDFSVMAGTETCTTSGMRQHGWKQGIMINGRVFMGNETININNSAYGVDIDYDDDYEINTSSYMNICVVDLPESMSRDATSEEGNIKVTNKPFKITTSDGLDYTKEETLYDYCKIAGVRDYRYPSGSGYNVYFSAPRNTTSYDKSYTVTVTDFEEDGTTEYGNKVTFTVYQYNKSKFKVRLFYEYSSNDKSVSDEVTENDYLIFSASGALRHDLYLATDATPSDGYPMVFGYYSQPTTYIYTNEISMDSTMFRNGSYDQSETMSSYNLLTSSGDGRVKTGENTYEDGTWYIYKIEPYSKVSKVYLPTSNNIEISLGHNPYTRSIKIGVVNESSYVERKSAHGSCKLAMTGPYVSYADTVFYCSKEGYKQYVDSSLPSGWADPRPDAQNDDFGEISREDAIVYLDATNGGSSVGVYKGPTYHADFNTNVDTVEYSKYHSSGSYTMANTYHTTSGSNNTFRIDDKMYIVYSESSTSVRDLMFSYLMETNGYYSAWKFDQLRREWQFNGGHSEILHNIYGLSSISGDDIVQIKTGTKTITFDSRYLQSITVPDYSSGSATDTDGKQPGMFLVLGNNTFTKNSSQHSYEYNGTTVTVSHQNVDSITFGINLILYLKK